MGFAYRQQANTTAPPVALRKLRWTQLRPPLKKHPTLPAFIRQARPAWRDFRRNIPIYASGKATATVVVPPGITPVQIALPEVNLAVTDALPIVELCDMTLPERSVLVAPITNRFKVKPFLRHYIRLTGSEYRKGCREYQE